MCYRSREAVSEIPERINAIFFFFNFHGTWDFSDYRNSPAVYDQRMEINSRVIFLFSTLDGCG